MKLRVATIFALAFAVTILSSCAKVGSERWCESMKETPKTEWSMDDAANFAKHCVKF